MGQGRAYSPAVFPAVRVSLVSEGQTVELPESTVRDLLALASRGDLSLIGALQQAIINENYLERLEASGTQLIIERRGRMRYLVRSRQPARRHHCIAI
jgi:hypothetical protein